MNHNFKEFVDGKGEWDNVCANCNKVESECEDRCFSDHEIQTNQFNIELCKKCKLPKERLTTNCARMLWGYIEWHSIVDGLLDYIDGECIYKEIEDEA